MDVPIADWLTKSAAAHPDRLAVADRERSLTYAELAREAGSLAGLLMQRGAFFGRPLAIDLPAGVDHVVALHAGFMLRAVVQSLPAAGGERAPCAAGAHIVDAETIAAVDSETWFTAVGVNVDGGPITRTLTSGTSGEPRAIEHSAANHLAAARASAQRLGVEPGDRWLCCLPLNHIGGLSILIRSAIYGTAAVIEPGFDAGRVASLFEAGEVTIASLVPTQLVRLLDAEAPVERPRLLLVGGGPLPLEVLEEALGRGATVVQTYGLTEACSQVCTMAPAEARGRIGSAGRPLAGTEVRIEAGEILVRGPSVAHGSLAPDGRLHTGDLGRLDTDGYLWVEGRRDDLIVTGGENVWPQRVEDVLRSHPDLDDVAVAGIEDREWGQVVAAFVVAARGVEVDPVAIRDFARVRLLRHEVPKRVTVVEALPRTSSGKVRRRLLT